MEETQPLLPALEESLRDRSEDAIKDLYIVTFDSDGDPENPMDWPNAYKWGIVGLLAFMAFTV